MSMATARRSLRTSGRSPSTSLSPATAATRTAATRQPLRHRQAPPAQKVEVEADDGDTLHLACPICFDTLAAPSKPGGRLLRSSWAMEQVWLDCGHVFCEPCLSHHASLAVQEGKTAAMAVGSGPPLECPMHGCNGAISEGTLKRLLSPADWAKHLRFTADAAMAADPRIKPCPKRRCQGTARLSAATLALLQASAPGSGSGSRGTYVDAVCRTCKQAFCCACGAASAHPDKTCEAAGDEAFFNWKRNKAVKPCPFCQYQTEKRGGCAHMWCVKCRNHWCWGCVQAIVKCSCYARFVPHNAYVAPLPNQRVQGLTRGGMLILAMVFGLFGLYACCLGLERADLVLALGVLLLGITMFFPLEAAGL